MRTYKFYFLSLLLCTLALGFTSCEKDDDDDNNNNTSSSIYGYWKPFSGELKVYVNGELVDEEYEENDEDYGVRFDKDGDFYYWEDYYGDVETEYGGTYSYKNGKLKIYEEYDDETYTYDITSLTSSKMVMESTESWTEDGDRYKYVDKMVWKKVNIDD